MLAHPSPHYLLHSTRENFAIPSIHSSYTSYTLSAMQYSYYTTETSSVMEIPYVLSIALLIMAGIAGYIFLIGCK
jgi:hypothetical protein